MVKATGRMCRHCHVRPGNRSRQLCSTCYYDPAIRAQHPSTSKMGRRPGADHEFITDVAQARKPTATEPGSEARIRVYAERARHDPPLAIFHPQDAAPSITAKNWREIALAMSPGDRLLYLARRAGMSGASTLAASSGVDEELIRSFMRGRKSLPFIDVSRLSEALEIEPAFILSSVGDLCRNERSATTRKAA